MNIYGIFNDQQLPYSLFRINENDIFMIVENNRIKMISDELTKIITLFSLHSVSFSFKHQLI